MRRLVWLILLIALLWGVWWAVAITFIERGLIALPEALREPGISVDIAAVETAGFPMRLDARLQNLRLESAANQTAVILPGIDISAPSYWPGYVTVTLPAAPITVQTPQGATQITVMDGVAGLRLRPGPNLQLQRISASVKSLIYGTLGAEILAAQDSQITISQQASKRATYALDFQVSDLTPGAPLRALLGRPADWPYSLETLVGKATVALAAPLDRTHLEAPLPQVRAFALNKAEAVWGTFAIAAEGALTFAADGIPDGSLSLRVSDWEVLLNMAETSGALPVNLRQQAEVMMRALAGLNGGADGALNLTLSFADGKMALGNIALGPAPRLRLAAPY